MVATFAEGKKLGEAAAGLPSPRSRQTEQFLFKRAAGPWRDQPVSRCKTADFILVMNVVYVLKLSGGQQLCYATQFEQELIHKRHSP
ncbi:MAG TPA: hypothetical protein VHI31_04335 [Actinomycetota bacterium]|nr:hypothetical protein [Actinomycetota bacterium]